MAPEPNITPDKIVEGFPPTDISPAAAQTRELVRVLDENLKDLKLEFRGSVSV